MSTSAAAMSVEEFEAYAAGHGRCELVRGEVRHLSPTGGVHGLIVARLTGELWHFLRSHHLGVVLGAETGFQVDDRGRPSVRAPDVAFLSNELARSVTPRFLTVRPDLAVEVLSPGDRASEVAEKVRWWLEQGTRIVWLIDPGTRSAVVHRTGAEPRRVGPGETLTGDDVLPGFELPMSDLFRGVQRE